MNNDNSSSSDQIQEEQSQRNSAGSESPDFGNLAPNQPILPSRVVQTIPPHLPLPSGNRMSIASRPRLIIDKIILQNFKSYAGKQVIGPFHENFTSVVGPNGSGKSNLIESMLFIFGYKANWMRLNRLNQLIHNSSTMSEVQSASVEVKFKKIVEEERSSFREMEGSFSLRRVVKMSGVSKYYINGSESTQKQVKEKLQEEGIDLNNNRFLILQGEVEQISQMKQKSGDREKPGLLEYLEDIIGSNIFIDQIEAGIQEYNMIEETKHEKGELMKLSEVQLKSMTKNKDEAIRYVKKQRHIYQIHNILLQVVISNNRYESKEHQQRLAKAEQDRQRIIEEEKEKLKKQAERIRQIKKNKAEIETIEKQLNKENELMGKLNFADKNINQEIQFRSEDLAKYEKKLKELDQDLSRIINESDQVNKELPEAKQKLTSLTKRIAEMEEKLIKYDKPELKKKLKDLENKLKKINHEINIFEEKRKAVKKTMDGKEKKMMNLELRKIETERKFNDSTEDLSKISQAETAATKMKDSLSRDLEDYSNRRKGLQGELEKIQINLKENLNQNKEVGMFNNMFEKIMQQRIPGVLGRLGDLGSVPRQYDEIITSCCNRLDNIVVENLAAANAVLDFLKASKLGRVTCIILDKIEEFKKYMKKPWNNLANSVRLFDMISPMNEEVRAAFYFAISDTIFCENSQLGMEYAMKDDKNRRRVISKKPNGYIIYELNGLMNGCNARRGGFDIKAKSKIKNNANELYEIKELEKVKKNLSEQITKIEEKFHNLKKQYESVSRDIDEIRREKKITESKIAEAKEELQEIEGIQSRNSKNNENENSRKEKQFEAIRDKISELEKEKSEYQKEMKEIEAEQRQNESEKIIELRDEHKISKQEHTLLEKSIQKKVAILETTKARIDDNKKNKEDLIKQINKLHADIKKLQKEIEDIEIKATETLARIKAGEDKIQKCKKVEEELKNLFEGEEKEVRTSKLKIDRAKEEVELCLNQIKVFTEAIEKAEGQLKKQRETYKQLSSSYDFLSELEEIEGMNIENVKRNSELNKSVDSSIILNQSLDTSNNSTTKLFPIDRLLETSPFDDLSEDHLDPFLLFSQKMRTMLMAEEENLKKMSGNNLQIITEFMNKFHDFKKKYDEFEEVKRAQMELKKKIEELKEKRLQCFREGFSMINTKLKEVYQLLTKGGDAELELIDSLDPFSDGINFSVRPPKKTWKEINKLSGGEKTLSSLSLIFALHYYKPTPLYFMDEIDAALDFKNVSIVADYIKKRTKDAQFIIISLRNNMFELADKLVGVYKTYDKTKIVQFIPSRLRKKQPGEKENLDSNQNLAT